jgi:Prp8 binding protein
VRFDPSGQHIASGGFDRAIRRFSRGSIGGADLNIVVLWNTYGNCANYLELNGHKGAILDLHWSRDSRIVFSASADSLLASWDAENGARIRRYVGHGDIINAFDVARRGPEVMVSGSDDGTVGVCCLYH